MTHKQTKAAIEKIARKRRRSQLRKMAKLTKLPLAEHHKALKEEFSNEEVLEHAGFQWRRLQRLQRKLTRKNL